MSDSSTQLITALIVLTQQGGISWKVSDDTLSKVRLGEGSIDGNVYESNVKGKTVLLIRMTYKPVGEYDSLQDAFYYRLVVLDDQRYPEAEFYDEFSLATLYEIVREKCHSVSGWVNDVVKELG